ncbi:MAG: hypothetical protein IKN98_07200 [Bacteroidales bacterium]|nr:hypothetical protein [Bacteroidales bacterium]
MKIPVPEVTDRFGSIENALCSIIRYCNVLIEKAKKVYPSISVNDIPGYALEFCRKIMVQATTLVKVAHEQEDLNTVYSLVRILADNVSTLKLIYDTEDDEEKVLRHLLYVMDGVSLRYDYLKNQPKPYDGKIPKETYDALYVQVQNTKVNDLGCINYCTNTIKARPEYLTKQQCYDKLIKYRNWKYKTIDKPKLKDAYSWKELYEKLDAKDVGYMFSYFSQYVHGLSISKITLDGNEDYDTPMAFAFSLVGNIFNFLKRNYVPYVGKFTREELYMMAPEFFVDNEK